MITLPIAAYIVFAFVMAILIVRAMDETDIFLFVLVFVFAPVATFFYVVVLLGKLIKLALTYKK